VMVLRSPGHRLAVGGDVPDGLVPAAWDALAALHQAGYAHLGLGARTLVVLPDGQIGLTDLRDAVAVPAPDQIATDDAALLATLATLVGADTAARESIALLGGERTMDLVPFLQSAAFGGELRRDVRTAHVDIDELRKAAIKETGEEEPVLAKLRRVSLGGLIQAALLVLAASAILSLFTSLDFDELRQSIEDASLGLVLVAFLVAQSPRLAQAVSTLGSVPARLPYGPVYAMQLATSFMNLALPSAAARMALSVRFFQRQGIPPATAVTSGLIDSLVGNVIQAVMLVLLLLFSPVGLDAIPAGDTASGSGGTDFSLMALIGLLVVVVVLAFLVVPRLRHAARDRLRAWWPEVKASLEPLRTRQKLGQLIGGNFAAEILFASALALMAHAFGADITIVDALFVNLASSLIALVIPVPGGIGVAEATLIAGLTAVGVDESTAFGITIAYRMSTFYLPPIWGWFAMRWLQKRRYL
jgi:glycosyltransferase 2 family protein